MIPHSAINLASGFEFSVILILPNNICWCFPVFEYFQWQQFLVNALSEEMPREDMSVVVGYFVKDQKLIKSELEKAMLISITKPKSGQTNKIWSNMNPND